MALKLKVTLVRSPIHREESQKATVRGLGLRHLHHSRVLEDTAPPGMTPAAPGLEDVYFATLLQHGLATDPD